MHARTHTLCTCTLPQHRLCTLSTCQPDTPTVIMSEFWEKRLRACACTCVCIVSVLAVLLQRVSLCCCAVLSQDYIPAEQRAGKYLLFISHCLYRSLAVSICLSSNFDDHILTPCLCSVVRWNSQVKHTLKGSWPDRRFQTNYPANVWATIMTHEALSVRV